jgi:hypothetical protein
MVQNDIGYQDIETICDEKGAARHAVLGPK